MKKWKCTVCGYIHEGPTPPEKCPICGVGPEKFVELTDDADAGAARELREGPDAKATPTDAKLDELMFNMSYGLYVIGAVDGDKVNAMISNSFMQVTSEPLQASVCINKANLTGDMISKTNCFAVSILNQTNHDLVPRFGFQSGHKVDKFADFDYFSGEVTGCPAIPGTICYLEVEVDQIIDLGTHRMFIGRVVGGKNLSGGEPMTYAYYRKTR